MENKVLRKNSKRSGLGIIFSIKYLVLSIFEKKENLILLSILLLGSFMRLFRIGDYMTFLGDEGRDVLVARGILHGDLTLLGPRSSAADFYYGPIYYYFITPFLFLFGGDPVGPAVMVALVGIATVFLVYIASKEFFGSVHAAIVAAALYSISPLVIAYSRSSWNPNPLPFVSLLSLFISYKAVKLSSIKLFLIVGILLGIALQLQYLALLLIAIILVFVFVGTLYLVRKIDLILLIKRYLSLSFGFLIGFSPFIAFEVLHGFPNTRTILRYIFTDDLAQPDRMEQPFATSIIDVFFRLFGRLLTRFPPAEQVDFGTQPHLHYWYWATIVLAIVSVYFISKIKNKLAAILIICWLGLGVGLFAFYKDTLYDYHLGFMFTLPFLLIGNALFQLGSLKNLKGAFLVSYIIFWILFTLNIAGNPFQYQPNRQKDQVRLISEFVLSKTDGKPFNFALITLGNSDHAYKYFMELKGRTPVEIKNTEVDPQRESVTDQLLIVCEDPNCKPLGNSLWEVAGFGRAEIEGEWPVSVVKVYKLRHYDIGREI